MARIRTIKPELARHEGLFAVERESGLPIRLVWALLPTICDREGRFKWRPRSLKCDILPYDDVDFARVLDVLLAADFLLKYRVDSDWYGAIPTFATHQRVNAREQASSLPAPADADETVTRAARVGHASPTRTGPARGEGKGREGKGTEERKGTELQLGAVNGSKPAASLIFLEFPTVGGGGGTYQLAEAQLSEWQELFPNLDVKQETRSALAWIQANPSHRKTVSGMPRFLVGWLERTTNRGGPRNHAAATNAQPKGGRTGVAAEDYDANIRG